MAANLSHLKIGRVPEAFNEWAQKHNQLVSLIESIEAAYGLDIKIIANPPKMLQVPKTPGANSKQTQGRIRIGLKPGIIPGAVGGGTGSFGTAQVVTFDGTLRNVAASGNVTSNYPLSLHINNNGTALDMTPADGFKAFDPANPTQACRLDEYGLTVAYAATGKSLIIDATLLTHNMSLVTINVCSNGVAKSMDIIASAPY